MSPPPRPLPSRRQTPPRAAAEPRYGQSFDPWNSSSTGHQRAENRLGASAGWRASRGAKLASQFGGGPGGGGDRVSDAVGAGSRDWDAGAGALVTPEVRARARNSVADMLRKPGTMKCDSGSGSGSGGANLGGPREGCDRRAEDEERTEAEMEMERARPRGMFEGVVVYVNGSTHPLISDHKLKHVLAEHGGRLSSHLGRRQVTHVILGRPAAGGASAGSGGGLAGGKLQKEIRKVGGCGVKFVGVEWVLESIKVGKRLPEARFGPVKVALKGQQSVYGLYSKKQSPGADDSVPPPSGQGRG